MAIVPEPMSFIDTFRPSCFWALTISMTSKKTHTLRPPKPHQTYLQLVEKLERRGMIIPDRERAERKLAQIGYYRLSGFWFPCREIQRDPNGNRVMHPRFKQIIRRNRFQAGTNFNDVVQLYLFDKKLRLLMMDAIERVEIHVRAIVAHEVGAHNPLAYQDDSFINPVRMIHTNKKTGKKTYLWKDWLARQKKLIRNSREDCIRWHMMTHKSIPFWVAIESWDFGMLSKYYSLLKASYQNDICARLGLPNRKILETWLREINGLRNKCAHHSRIWNHSFFNQLPIFQDPYFDKLNLDKRSLRRMYGMICILWYLVKKIGPSSGWLNDIANLVNSKPAIDSCPFTAMGFPDNSGFPRGLCYPLEDCGPRFYSRRAPKKYRKLRGFRSYRA